jgi:CO/xanthine dehydrogenase FAD-binding subunit
MRILRPSTLNQALTMLRENAGPVTPLAGGTDLFVSWPGRDREGLTLLDLSRIDELRGVHLDENELTLGALATYWDTIGDRAVAGAFPLLRAAALQVGAIQIQTRGTWAGNIGNGSPAADGVPAMMAYDAEVELASLDGRERVRLDEYWTGYKQSRRRPDQLIVAIRLPRRAHDAQWWHKVGARGAQAISKVGVAVTHAPEGWRVAANSVAPCVKRCRALERALDQGRTFDSPAQIRDLLRADVAPIDDIRSTAAYRLNVLSRVLYYGLIENAPA